MIDTHCHLTYPDFSDDFEHVVQRAADVGVTDIVIPGTDLVSSKQAIDLAATYAQLHACAALHPIHAHEQIEGWEEEFRGMVAGGNLVAIGEIGLDYYHMEGIEEGDVAGRQRRIDQQMACLATQLNVAHEFDLPIIVHSRDCFTDLHTILRSEHNGKKAVIHCFTGTKDEAFTWLDLGFLISFTGILTYKKSSDLREVAASIPLDRIMIETDAPYLAPEGHRGKRCEPMFVRNVAECLAEIRGVSNEEIDRITSATARKFFEITG